MSEVLKSGMPAPDFTIQTPWGKTETFYKMADGKKCFLFFLRYVGCTLCQVEIHQLIQSYHRFAEKDAKFFVVLQSAPENIRENLTQEQIPFTIICDPEQAIYRTYHVKAAENQSEMGTPDLFADKLKIAQKNGFSHGKYEGNELQLPATFLIDQDHSILFAHYGSHVGDTPDHGELLKLL
ncbi:MAG TPA: peroxiredoxin-like family protein [Clostridia bacterium]|nr:peroxiredoxin-like family protein [Clostridia bacterium]